MCRTSRTVVIVVIVLLSILLCSGTSLAAANTLNITIEESFAEMIGFVPGLGELRSGTTPSGIALSDLIMNGTITIFNTGNYTLSDINLTLTGTDDIDNPPFIVTQPGYVDAQVSNYNKSHDVYIFMRSLKPNDTVVLGYLVNATNIGEPINITESFSNDKVLTNETINISIKLKNSLQVSVSIWNLSVRKVPQSHVNSEGNHTYFQFTTVTGPDAGATNLSTGMDALGVNYTNLTWTPNAGTGVLAQGQEVEIHLIARAPVDLNGSWNGTNWGQYLVIGNLSTNMVINQTVSGLSVADVIARGPVQIAALKQRQNNTHWRGGINITNIGDTIDYNVTEVTVFATKLGTTDPGDTYQWLNVSRQIHDVGTITVNPTATTVDLNDDGSVDFIMLENESAIRIDLSNTVKDVYIDLTNATDDIVNISVVNSSLGRLINFTRKPIANLGWLTIHANVTNNMAIAASQNVTIEEEVNHPSDSSGSFYQAYPNAAVAANQTYQYNNLLFAYDFVPIVWADADIMILDDGTQISRIQVSQEREDQYIFVEEIFVLSGYIIKASKQIEAHGALPNLYNVTIVLENMGNDKTPDEISLFDLIPPEFYPIRNIQIPGSYFTVPDRNMTENQTFTITNYTLYRGVSNTGVISNQSTLYDYYAGYRIDLKALQRFSNGDGIYDGDNNEVQIFYILNGTGSLKHIRSAYLVGVDPKHIEGASATREIGSTFSATSDTVESSVLLGTMISSVILGLFIVRDGLKKFG